MPLFINIKAVPSSGKQGCAFDKSGTLKCYLKSAPEGGKANAELIKYLSKKLKVPQNEISIVGGTTSRKKRLKIEGITLEEFYQKLSLEKQQTIL